MDNIVISGGYGLGNFGDDALLLFLVRYLRRCNSEFNLYLDCNKAKYLEYIGEFESDLFRLSGESVRIYGGGTVFYQFPNQDTPVFNKVLKALVNPFLLYRWLQVRYARALVSKIKYNKTILLGIGFGPFYNHDSPQYRWAMDIAINADEVIVRDAASYEFSSKYNAKTIKGVDICFADTDIKFPEKRKGLGEKPRVGVILRDWNNGTEMDNYIEETYAQLQEFPEDSFEIDYLIFSASSDRKTMSFLKSKKEPIIYWKPDSDSVESFLMTLNKYDLFISSRFHGLVFSTLLGKPSIGVEIEPKITLSKDNAIAELWRPNSGASLLRIVNSIIDNYDYYQSECDNLVRKNRELFENTFSL